MILATTSLDGSAQSDKYIDLCSSMRDLDRHEARAPEWRSSS